MSPPSPSLPRHPALITASVVLASLLYSLDWTIAAVALPHMQGTFSASHEQIGWVMTSYIVASAIMIPTAGWLSTRFGRKRVFVCATFGFLVSSVLCGAADSLAVEVFARIAQGMSGAFLIPLSHAIILDTYPPEEQGRAMALWGTGSVLGSVIGPTVGGYVTEYLTWRYIFYINLPFGLLALLGALAFVPETRRDRHRRLDWFGFLALSLGIGALQMMVDRGGRLDWFESAEIMLEASLAGLGFYLFAVHSLTTREPFLDLNLIVKRNFFVGLLFVFMYGILTLPPMVLMPPFLQDVLGYPIDTVGLLLTPRGVGMLLAMFASGRISGLIDPRILIAFGLVCLAAAGFEMANWNTNVGVWSVLWTGLLQGVGAGIILVPIQVIAFPSLPPHQRTEATAVFNLVRSVGSSLGVSLALALFVHTSAVSHSQLVERATPYSRALRFGTEEHGWNLTTRDGLATLEREITRQATAIAYIGDFRLLPAFALAALPLLLLVGRSKSLEPPGVGASRAFHE